MTTRKQLLYEIENAPDVLLEEVLDFLVFAKNRRQPPSDEPEQPLDPAQSPIWASFEEFTEQLPEDISAPLQTDRAAQIDHYLYGSPNKVYLYC